MNPSRSAHLKVVPPSGEIADWMPSNYAEAIDVIQGLSGKLAAASGQITRLQKALESQRAKENEAEQIEAVLLYWRDLCKPRATVVAGSKRWEKVRARLHDRITGRPSWTVDELKLVVDGALKDPWLNGFDPKSKGYLDALTLFRDAEQVEKLIALAMGTRYCDCEHFWASHHADGCYACETCDGFSEYLARAEAFTEGRPFPAHVPLFPKRVDG